MSVREFGGAHLGEPVETSDYCGDGVIKGFRRGGETSEHRQSNRGSWLLSREECFDVSETGFYAVEALHHVAVVLSVRLNELLEALVSGLEAGVELARNFREGEFGHTAED